jgi:hypothetical protein
MSPALAETNLYRGMGREAVREGHVPASTPSDAAFKQVAGSVVTNVDTGNENFSDGTAFGDRTIWLNSITGSGTPGLEGGTDETRVAAVDVPRLGVACRRRARTRCRR